MKERPLFPVRRVEESYKLEEVGELYKIRAGKIQTGLNWRLDSHKKAA